jgi:Sad1 / UNC-like C-terminal
MIFGLAPEASSLIKESSSPKHWLFRGSMGSVGIRFARRVNIIGFSIDTPHIVDGSGCGPKSLEIWGLLHEDTQLQGSERFRSTYNIEFSPSILLAEHELESNINNIIFPMDSQLCEPFDTILLIIHSSLNQSHTCLDRFRVYGK